MTKTITSNGAKVNEDWHADVPCFKKPKIQSTYFINGVKMYKGYDGKTYHAQIFDDFFNPKSKVVVMGKYYKGENSNKQMIL